MTTDPELYDYGYGGATALPALGDLQGMDVCDVNGDKIGEVEDTYTDPSGSYARYLAVKTGWFGNKRHMIPVDDVQTARDDDGERYLTVPYSKDVLENAPAYERDEEFTREHEQRTYAAYDRSAYWDIVETRQTPPAPTPEIAEAEIADAINRGDDPREVAVKRWGV